MKHLGTFILGIASAAILATASTAAFAVDVDTLLAQGHELKAMNVATTVAHDDGKAVMTSGAFWLQKDRSAYFCITNVCTT